MDEIFELVMKEARTRPGDNLYINAFNVMVELSTRIVNSCNSEIKTFLDSCYDCDKPA